MSDPNGDELLLQRYVDGELRPAERDGLERRLARDAELAARLRVLEATRRGFDSLRDERRSVVPLGVGFADRVWSRLREPAPVTARPPALKTLQHWSLVAASIAVLLGIALMTFRPAQPARLEAGPALNERLRELDRKAAAEAKARAAAKDKAAERKRHERDAKEDR